MNPQPQPVGPEPGTIEYIVENMNRDGKQALANQVKTATELTAMLTGPITSTVRESLADAELIAWGDVQRTLISAFRSQHIDSKRGRR